MSRRLSRLRFGARSLSSIAAALVSLGLGILGSLAASLRWELLLGTVAIIPAALVVFEVWRRRAASSTSQEDALMKALTRASELAMQDAGQLVGVAYFASAMHNTIRLVSARLPSGEFRSPSDFYMKAERPEDVSPSLALEWGMDETSRRTLQEAGVSYMAVPLVLNGKLLGVLSIASSRRLPENLPARVLNEVVDTDFVKKVAVPAARVDS